MKTKIAKQVIKRKKELETMGDDFAEEFRQMQFFNKSVPSWLRWLMQRVPKLIPILGYSVGKVEDSDRLIITRKTLFGKNKGRDKFVAKNYG